MKKVESLIIKYVGYKEPSTEAEVELEILGLQTAIAAAKQRIAVLSQGLVLQKLMSESVKEDTTDEKTVAEASDTKETE